MGRQVIIVNTWTAVKREQSLDLVMVRNLKKTSSLFNAFASLVRVVVGIIVVVIQQSPASAFTLRGKTALVTGSAGGIGKGIAKTLADNGVKVILHYNTRREEAMDFQSELGPDKCLGVLHCDFTSGYENMKQFMVDVQYLCHQYHAQCRSGTKSDETSNIESMENNILSTPLDILVNNAGVVSKLAFEDDDDDMSNWHSTMAVNLEAPLFLSKLFAEAQRKHFDHTQTKNIDSSEAVEEDSEDLLNGNKDHSLNHQYTGGVILHVGSIHGEKSNEYMGAYAASKAALESITRTMAIEYAPLMIRVNTIAPGVVPVERTANAFSDPATMKSWTDRLPLGRTGTVHEIAHACLPLLENDWITGCTWTIDGGMMSRANMPERPRPPKPPI